MATTDEKNLFLELSAEYGKSISDLPQPSDEEIDDTLLLPGTVIRDGVEGDFIRVPVARIKALSKGDTGDPAGFGTPTVSISGGVGTPAATVSATGPDTAKVFAFTFSNLKGDKGDPFTYSDFTPAQIAELQRPATEAAANANEKATLANTAATAANTAAGNANTAASAANTAKQNADSAASAANTAAGNVQTAIDNANTAKDNASAAAVAANTAKQNADTATQNAEAATTGASRVNATLSGTTLSVTDRNGNTTSVNLKGEKGDTGEGFSVYRTFDSIAAMNNAASSVPEGKYVQIASNTEDVDNAKLYVKNSSGGFTFVVDMSGAQGIKGDPFTYSDFTPAQIAELQKPAQDKADEVQEWYEDTQSAWNSWFGTSSTTGVRKSYADWVAAKDTDWSSYKGDKDTDWSTYKTTKDADWNTYKQGKNSDFTTWLSARLSDWNTWWQARKDEWTAWFSDTAATGVRKLWNDFWSTVNTQWPTLKQEAETARDNANEKAALANEKAGLADTKAGYAQTQGDYAKNMAEHPAYIGTDNYWYLWDYATQAYTKGAYSKGDNLNYDDLTDAEKQQLVSEIRSSLVLATVAEGQSAISELS